MTPDNQYFHHFNDFPSDYQYVENSRSPSQAVNGYPAFNCTPYLQSGQQLTSTPATTSNNFTGNYNFPSSMSTVRSLDGWSTTPMILQQYQSPDDNQYLSNHNYRYGAFSSASLGNNQDQPLLRDMGLSNVPRSSPSFYDTDMLDNNVMNSETFDPSLCHLDSSNEPDCSPRKLPGCLRRHAQDSPKAFARLSVSRSPKLKSSVDRGYLTSYQQETFRAPSSPDSDDGGGISREMTVIDSDDRGGDADEPYAKLIYRALMSAPNHSMVLQEIYRWFRENTSKGSSDSKGWMNSIRHNLSMNAAFKKTERKLPGDETKKSTEWVLEDFAVKDGVQSTTRYRSKGSGPKKFIKLESPAPARQTSGRKGGLSTSKSKSRQRAKAERHDRYHSLRQLDMGTGLHQQQHPRTQLNQQFPLSPSPPPHLENISSPSPYNFHRLAPQDSIYEEFCGGLEIVDGVDVNGPLFTPQSPRWGQDDHEFATGIPIDQFNS